MIEQERGKRKMSVERLKHLKKQVMAASNMIRNIQRELEREIGAQNRAAYNGALEESADEAMVVMVSEKVIEALNQQTGKSFDPMADNTLYLIRRLIERGYGLDHLLLTIDFMVEEWGDREEMQLYLRPQTLFGDNFESYLQLAVGYINRSRLLRDMAKQGTEG